MRVKRSTMGLFDRCRGESEKGTPEKVPEKDAEEATAGPERAQWASPTEFLLTCIGYSVGLGNVWRFPYLCYKSGGGAFLIPYVIMMCLLGMPLLFMEYSFGQYFGVGGLTVFKKVCPMFQGVGVGYMVLNGLVCIYYNVIIAMALYYLFASFTSSVPWASCDHSFNTAACGDPEIGNGTYMNDTLYNETSLYGVTPATAGYNGTMSPFNATKMVKVSPSDEYFRLGVLAMDETHSIENLGEVRWHLCLCLLLAWILVVIFVSRGIKSTGKVAYFTATFPYLMLTVLVVRGVTLEGASKGILYFITPDWKKLASPEVWFGAASQLFYSTNLAWGGMITMSSYSSFNHNCYRDAIMINIVSFFTSLYAGFAVFSIIGYMANLYNIDVENVINSGPGLAFIVYPRALSLMPLAPMWSALFFFMLFLLGVGSQMVILETVVTGLVDEFEFLGRNARVRFMTTVTISCILLICGLAMTTQMVLIETVVTGIVDEFPLFGRNARVRFMTTISVASVLFICGIASTTQMVQVETILTGIMDTFPNLRAKFSTRIATVIAVCSCGFFIGISMVTKMVDLETVMSGLCDEFPVLRRYRFATLLVVSTFFFLCGIAQVTQGGMYVLQLMDWYSAGFSVLVIAVVECVVINWIYGNDTFASNVKEMLGHYPGIWWRICWKYVAPILILGILLFSFVQYEAAKYGTYTYPVWADFLGWVMVFASVLPIFIIAFIKFFQADGATFLEKWKAATAPQLDPDDVKQAAIEVRERHPSKASRRSVEEILDESDFQRTTLLGDIGNQVTPLETSKV